MQPIQTIESVTMSDGSVFVLRKRGDEWVVYVNERVLMSSRMHDSEEELAELALKRIPNATGVFIGGLGLGFTLRAALDQLGADAKVIVAELVPAVVEWNRTHLGALARRPMDDPRVSVLVGDALTTLAARNGEFDAILLDVDNGPVALSQSSNQRLYSDAGIRQCMSALRHGGVLAVWSAGPSVAFEKRLQARARNVEVLSVAARKGARGKHRLFIAMR